MQASYQEHRLQLASMQTQLLVMAEAALSLYFREPTHVAHLEFNPDPKKLTVKVSEVHKLEPLQHQFITERLEKILTGFTVKLIVRDKPRELGE